MTKNSDFHRKVVQNQLFLFGRTHASCFHLKLIFPSDRIPFGCHFAPKIYVKSTPDRSSAPLCRPELPKFDFGGPRFQLGGPKKRPRSSQDWFWRSHQAARRSQNASKTRPICALEPQTGSITDSKLPTPSTRSLYHHLITVWFILYLNKPVVELVEMVRLGNEQLGDHRKQLT